MLERQLLMIEPKQMENRRVEVIERMNVLHRFLAELIRHPVTYARFCTGAGQPTREAVRIMITTFRTGCGSGTPRENVPSRLYTLKRPSADRSVVTPFGVGGWPGPAEKKLSQRFRDGPHRGRAKQRSGGTGEST